MRWPLRYQILFPFAGVMLAVVVGLSLLEAYLSARRTQHQVERQLQEVALTLADATFPLTDAVLKQTRGLSGAEFVLTDRAGAGRGQPGGSRRGRAAANGHAQRPGALGPGDRAGRAGVFSHRDRRASARRAARGDAATHPVSRARAPRGAVAGGLPATVGRGRIVGRCDCHGIRHRRTFQPADSRSPPRAGAVGAGGLPARAAGPAQRRAA